MICFALLFSSLCAFQTVPFLEHNRTVYYWGQNSVHAAGGTTKRLKEYCDSNVDVMVICFLVGFGTANQAGDYEFNFANMGDSAEQVAAIGEDIKYCQNQGKQVLLSLGGAAGTYGFANDADGKAVAKDLHNMVGTGRGTVSKKIKAGVVTKEANAASPRIWGDVEVDGYDLDIEGGGVNGGYGAFITEMRNLEPCSIIAGAPQCPFPDYYLNPSLETAWYDYVFIQFYNNWGSAVANGAISANFNYDTWNTWATTKSVNPNVRLFLGIPGHEKGANAGYWPSFSQLEPIVNSIKANTSNIDHFGGIMMWDATLAFFNFEGGIHYAKKAHQVLQSAFPGTYNGPSPPVIGDCTSRPSVGDDDDDDGTNESGKVGDDDDDDDDDDDSAPSVGDSRMPTGVLLVVILCLVNFLFIF